MLRSSLSSMSWFPHVHPVQRGGRGVHQKVYSDKGSRSPDYVWCPISCFPFSVFSLLQDFLKHVQRWPGWYQEQLAWHRRIESYRGDRGERKSWRDSKLWPYWAFYCVRYGCMQKWERVHGTNTKEQANQRDVGATDQPETICSWRTGPSKAWGRSGCRSNLFGCLQTLQVGSGTCQE